MITLKDILTEQEVKEYHEQWESFPDKQKYKPESEYHVHSGMNVIGKVFRFHDKPLFRARVISKRKLRRIDPYFISERHIFPHWHIVHYFIVLEQMYHASMRQIRDTDKFRTLEVPQEIKLSNRIFWRDNISVELIWQQIRQSTKYSIEDVFFTLYDEGNKIKSRISARTFVEPRAYVKSIEKIKQDGMEEIDRLIEMIESRAYSQRNLIKPRQNLPDKDYLINELRKGKIPEQELHDFFSFWDKPKA